MTPTHLMRCASCAQFVRREDTHAPCPGCGAEDGWLPRGATRANSPLGKALLIGAALSLPGCFTAAYGGPPPEHIPNPPPQQHDASDASDASSDADTDAPPEQPEFDPDEGEQHIPIYGIPPE